MTITAKNAKAIDGHMMEIEVISEVIRVRALALETSDVVQRQILREVEAMKSHVRQLRQLLDGGTES